MNENAKKWVEALRSGEYRQAKGALRRSPKAFCCLGVACDLYARDTEQGEWDKHTFTVGEDRNAQTLPDPVRDWLGLKNNIGYAYPVASLASRNDQGATFEQIADIIESEPEGLFA